MITSLGGGKEAKQFWRHTNGYAVWELFTKWFQWVQIDSFPSFLNSEEGSQISEDESTSSEKLLTV